MKTAGAQLGPWDDLTAVDNVARGQGAAEAVAMVGSSGLSRKMLSMVTDPLSWPSEPQESWWSTHPHGEGLFRSHCRICQSPREGAEVTGQLRVQCAIQVVSRAGRSRSCSSGLWNCSSLISWEASRGPCSLYGDYRAHDRSGSELAEFDPWRDDLGLPEDRGGPQEPHPSQSCTVTCGFFVCAHTASNVKFLKLWLDTHIICNFYRF